jgi:hypothetical protein
MRSRDRACSERHSAVKNSAVTRVLKLDVFSAAFNERALLITAGERNPNTAIKAAAKLWQTQRASREA